MRRHLAAGLLCLLVVGAGCTALSPGGGDLDREALAAERDYAWGTDADVTITIDSAGYEAVVRVDGRSRLAFSAFERLNERRPLGLEAIAYRHPNGTVVGADAMAVEQNGTHTTVTLPGQRGRFAYRVPVHGKAVHVATPVAGSYEVVLPPDTHVRYPLLGRVQPAGYETRTVDGRVHLRWDAVTDDRLVVEYYLVRDLWLFGGLLVVGLLVAAAGTAYFWLQLRRLRDRRTAVDLEEG